MVTVRTILERKGAEVISINSKASVLEAAQKMNDRRIGSLVVVEGDRVIGILTERDILRRVTAAERDPRRTMTHEIMTSPVACCRLETTLDECRAVMTERRIRRLPVVEEGELRGIITSGDILAYDLKEHQNTISYLNEYLQSSSTPHGADV